MRLHMLSADSVRCQSPLFKQRRIPHIHILGSDIINAVISMPLFARIHEEGIKVVLGGDGSDELFAGYHMYRHVSRDAESKLFVHNLMSLHPEARAPRFWELYRPCPSSGDLFETSRRQKRAASLALRIQRSQIIPWGRGQSWAIPAGERKKK